MIIRLITTWLLLTVTAIRAFDQQYSENLDIRPLSKRALLASFTFNTIENVSTSSTSGIHYGIFPRSLGQALLETDTFNLQLRFTQGYWDPHQWGQLPSNGSTTGGTGVEVWAWIHSNKEASSSSLEAKWKQLVNSLSGLFCASLNFIDFTITAYPIQGNNNLKGKDARLFYGALPREPVCTENLTPFMKLLPCKGYAGLSSLLHGHQLFDTQFQGMALDVKAECFDNYCILQLNQTVNSVIDVGRTLERRHHPVPIPIPYNELECDISRPYSSVPGTCMPLPYSTQTQKWSLSQIFARSIKGRCMLDPNPACIHAHMPPGWKAVNHTQMTFTLNDKHQDLDIVFEHNNTQDEPVATIGAPPPVYIDRYLTGYGQQGGGMRAIFTNPIMEPVTVVYMEVLPWFVKPYLHTLRVTIRQKQQEQQQQQQDILEDIYYQPSVDRSRPTHVETTLVIPANSEVVLDYSFDKSFLYNNEYPPDANRGFDIAPAVATVISRQNIIQYTLRTTSLLIDLPTPDFSMPYNVIILTSTVISLIFGSLVNILVRRFIFASDLKNIKRTSWIKSLFK